MTNLIPDHSLKDETRYLAECFAEALDAIGDRITLENIKAYYAEQMLVKAQATLMLKDRREAEGQDSLSARS